MPAKRPEILSGDKALDRKSLKDTIYKLSGNLVSQIVEAPKLDHVEIQPMKHNSAYDRRRFYAGEDGHGNAD